MKPNLNSIILGSNQYLSYIIDKYNTSKEDYEIFKQNNESINHHVLPYLYTFSLVNEKEVSNFWIFYQNYLDKSEITEEAKDIEVISNDTTLLVTYIIAAQYYFL